MIASGRAGLHTPAVVVGCAALILSLSLGTRQSFGLFLAPMSLEFGWGRSTFAFAMALTNLLWGLFQPLFGAFADRHGATNVVAGSALLFALGLALMPVSDSALALDFSAGLLVGLALCGTTFGVVLAVVSRAYPPQLRARGRVGGRIVWAVRHVAVLANADRLAGMERCTDRARRRDPGDCAPLARARSGVGP